jgi:hypothetical protein
VDACFSRSAGGVDEASAAGGPSIALTSRLAEGLDQPSPGWLGHDAARTEISQSGLWNIEHTCHHEPSFLNLLSQQQGSLAFTDPRLCAAIVDWKLRRLFREFRRR